MASWVANIARATSICSATRVGGEGESALVFGTELVRTSEDLLMTTSPAATEVCPRHNRAAESTVLGSPFRRRRGEEAVATPPRGTVESLRAKEVMKRVVNMITPQLVAEAVRWCQCSVPT